MNSLPGSTGVPGQSAVGTQGPCPVAAKAVGFGAMLNRTEHSGRDALAEAAA